MAAPIPETMRYINVRSPGGAEQMEIAVGPTPWPQAGEVLIRVAAAGVNRADVMQRLGSYPPPPGASPILGLEAAGTIVAAGPDTDPCRVGDEVCALVPGGGYAEFCVCPALLCLPIPKGVDAVHAAAVPEAFFTVWANVFRRGRLSAGEKLLVHGGSSGIGTTAIQLARALGSVVYVTAGSDEKCARCVQLGAAAAINYRRQDFAQEIARLTANQGVDVILDMVGGPYVERNLKSLAVGGRLVYIALMQGSRADVDLRLIMAKRLTVTGSTLRPLPLPEKAVLAGELRQKAWPLLENGSVQPIICQVFPFSEAAEAHRLMESSAHIGKIVLTWQ